MDNLAPYHLTFSQKLSLALSVFIIYWPIRLYVNIDHFRWDAFLHDWPLWVLEIPVTILFFILWLSVTGWLERGWMGQVKDFHTELKWPLQFVTLGLAATMAVLFNSGFYAVWQRIDDWLDEKEPLMILQHQNEENRHLRDNNRRNRRSRINNGLSIMAMLSAFYLSANRRSYKQLETLRVNAEQLKREASQAQLAALKNQVNPHFLFNSLSILTSLVEVDTRLSVQFINRLAKAYRYILEQRDAEQVSLQTELDFLASYTFLLNIRFEGKLEVSENVNLSISQQYKIAPLTLQLLVENAVKHNQMSLENPLRVDIRVQGDYLWVSNPLQLRPLQEISTGIGLQNIINQYKLLTSHPVWAGEEDGFFIVKIPLLI
jgi:hypothetical protein